MGFPFDSQIGPAAQNFVTRDFFPEFPSPDKLFRDTSIRAVITITGANAEGIIFEIGTGINGVAIVMSAGDLWGAAGGAGLQQANGAHFQHTLPTSGQFEIILAIDVDPVATVAVFVDGIRVGKVATSTGNFPGAPELFSTTEGGAILQLNGGLTGRVPAVTTPVNFTLDEPVQIAHDYLPPGF